MNADFDRTSRYILTARAVRALVEPPGPILDVGGSGGLLATQLPSYHIVSIDVAGADVDALASGAALPFADDTFDAAVALDVLEHVPDSLRSSLVSESLRVASSVVFAGPYADIAVSEAEAHVDRVYLEMTGQNHRWLAEHRDYGLPDLAEVTAMIESVGHSIAIGTSNPLTTSVRCPMPPILWPRTLRSSTRRIPPVTGWSTRPSQAFRSHTRPDSRSLITAVRWSGCSRPSASARHESSRCQSGGIPAMD